MQAVPVRAVSGCTRLVLRSTHREWVGVLVRGWLKRIQDVNSAPGFNRLQLVKALGQVVHAHEG